MAQIAVIPFVLILTIACVLIPVLIGTYVYRDAKARGLNASVWTLISILAPGYIGFIAYLIVRSEKSALLCPACGKNVREDFSLCPHCGSSLKTACSRCGYPLENGWRLCPNCSEPVPYEMQTAVSAEKKSERSLKKIIVLAIVIPLILCLILVGAGGMLFRLNEMTAVCSSDSTPDKRDIDSEYVQAWLESCDKKGKGVYVLREPESARDYARRCLVYRNDIYCGCEFRQLNKTLFKNAKAQFIFNTDLPYSGKDYTLVYYSGYYSGQNDGYGYDIVVSQTANGETEELEYDLTVAQSLEAFDLPDYISASTVALQIIPDDDFSDVYELSWTLYDGADAVCSEGTQGAFKKGEPISFSYDMVEAVDRFTVSVSDASGVVFESEEYKLIEGMLYTVHLKTDENGEITVSDVEAETILPDSPYAEVSCTYEELSVVSESAVQD